MGDGERQASDVNASGNKDKNGLKFVVTQSLSSFQDGRGGLQKFLLHTQ